MRKLKLVVAAALVLASCSRARLGAEGDDTFVEFRNESTEQAAVYVVGPAGEDQRIGTVSSGRTELLRVPVDMVRRGAVSFVARLLARSETPSSGPVNIRPGDRYLITLPSHRGSLTVLPGS